jgi:phosphoribosyl-ATP pyrophosphohydrolase/phosphoribosyl-AMP cyclohydrolase
LVDIKNDCDGDTLLIQAKPDQHAIQVQILAGKQNKADYGFISHLEQTIETRRES